MNSRLVPLTVLAALALVADRAPAGEPIPLSLPSTVTESGDYVLTDDLSVARGPILIVAAERVRIDFDGHVLTSLGHEDSVVVVQDLESVSEYVSFRNGTIIGGKHAVDSPFATDGVPSTLALTGFRILDCGRGINKNDGFLYVSNSTIDCDETMHLTFGNAPVSGVVEYSDLRGSTISSSTVLRHNRVFGDVDLGSDASGIVLGNLIIGDLTCGGLCDAYIARNTIRGSLFVDSSFVVDNVIVGGGVTTWFSTLKGNLVIDGKGIEAREANLLVNNSMLRNAGYGLTLHEANVYGGNHSRENALGDLLILGPGNVSRGTNYLPDLQ